MVKDSAAAVFFPPIVVASGYFGYMGYHQFYLGVLGVMWVTICFIWVSLGLCELPSVLFGVPVLN
jgi:TM2 domain-containing membrane protein YozV